MTHIANDFSMSVVKYWQMQHATDLSSTRWIRVLARMLPVLVVFAAIFTVFWVRLDPDFGWHLQSGQYILAHGVPNHDIFSYTAAGFPWVNHEWLSDVLIAIVYSIFGYAGVAALFAALWTAALAVASRHLHWPVLALGLAAMLGTITARPNGWTALFLALTLLGIRRGRYWVLVPLFGLWANLHGGFIVGFVVIALAGWWKPRYWLVLGASVGATLINPYGLNLYVEVWRTLSDANLRLYISEWRPLTVEVLNGLFIVVYLLIGSVKGWRSRKLILPGLLLVSAMSSMRQFPLFVLTALGLVDEGYYRLSTFLNVKAGWREYLLPVAAVLLVTLPIANIIVNPDNRSPVAQVAQLRAKPCIGNLFNDYDFGGYLIWRLPGTKIYIDGRMASWRYQGHYYLGDWEADMHNRQAQMRDFARYQVGCVLVRPVWTRLVADLQAEGWTVSSKDSQGVLLRRP